MTPISLQMDSDRRNRLFLKYHKALDLFFPLGSKRRLLIVALVNALLRSRGMGIRGFIVLIENFFSDLAEGFRGDTAENNAKLTFSRTDLELLTQINITEVKAMNTGCSPNPRISIIIPAMNKWTYTYCCLRFISRLEDLVPFEVIVVDNGSTDQTKEMLALISDISVIRNENNVGFVEACNMGVRASRGEFVLFLNNDAMIVNGSLDNMVALMDGDRTTGAVGAKLVYPDGRLQEAGGIIWNDPVYIGLNYGKFENPLAYEYNYVREVDYCSGACLLVRKDLFVRVGLFDAEFAPAYFEDTNLAFALRSIGYKTLYQPKAVAFHFEGVTAGTDVRKGMKQYQEINQKKFCDRWRQVLKMEHYPHRQNLFLARDRSRFKKTMLYIDHDIPTFDKDAGSMITFEYLKLFLNMNIKIVFWPATLREIEPYVSLMQKMGIEVVYGHVSFDRYIKNYGRYFELAFVSRPLTSVSFLNKIRRYSMAKIFYIAHDLHFLREFRRAETEGNEALKKYALKLKKLEMSLMEVSDISLVFSSVEKSIINQENPRIHIELMPWIQKINPNNKGYEKRSDILFIGSFIHKPNIDSLVWFVKSIFPLVKNEIKDIKLIVVGSNPTAEILDLGTNDVVVKGYVPDASPYFENTRIMVAPLRYGAGVKGKVLEAMSYGLPVVTTSIGAEGIELQNRENVFIAEEPRAIAECIVELYTSKVMWNKISVNSMDYIIKNHSMEYARNSFATFFGDVVKTQ